MTDSTNGIPRPKRAVKGGANPIDAHVGSRVRLRRTLLGMSQERLAKAVNLTFQQIQKYERGSNRIGASRLFQLAQVLDVPISFFYEELPTAFAASSAIDIGQEPFAQDQFTRRETLELVRAYYRIAEPSVRRRVLDLAKTLAHTDGRRGPRRGA